MNELSKIIELLELNNKLLGEITEFVKPKVVNRVVARSDPIPYEKIRDMFNNICTGLKKCEVLNDKRKRAIKKLWSNHLPDLDRWGQYFSVCNQDVWFNGIKYSGNIDTVLQEDKVIRMFEEGPRHA